MHVSSVCDGASWYRPLGHNAQTVSAPAEHADVRISPSPHAPQCPGLNPRPSGVGSDVGTAVVGLAVVGERVGRCVSCRVGFLLGCAVLSNVFMQKRFVDVGVVPALRPHNRAVPSWSIVSMTHAPLPRLTLKPLNLNPSSRT